MSTISNISNYILGLSPVVIDIIFAVIILAIGLAYAKKGLYQIAATLLIVVLAFAIGIVVSNIAREPVLEIVWEKYGPSVEEAFDKKVDSILNGTTNLSEALKSGWNSILENIGLEQLNSLKIEADPDIDYTDSSLVENLKAYTLVKAKLGLSKIIGFAIFGITVAISLLLLTFAKNLIGKLTKLPVIKWVDTFGGFVVGIAWGTIIMLIIVRVANLVGIQFFNNLSEGTLLLNWITQGNMNDAIDLVKNFNINDIKNINISQETQKIIEGYNNSQLSEGTNTVSEMVKNLSTEDLENLINNIANKINQ